MELIFNDTEKIRMTEMNNELSTTHFKDVYLSANDDGFSSPQGIILHFYKEREFFVKAWASNASFWATKMIKRDLTDTSLFMSNK